MKKLIASSLVAATMLTTAATADIKVGVGSDLPFYGTYNTTLGLGGTQPALRISIDGLVKGLRIEPRFNITTTNDGAATATTTSTMTLGLGAYYDVLDGVAVGAIWQNAGATSTQVGTGTAVVTGNSETDIAVCVKTEKELTKNLSIAYELGLQFPSTNVVTAGVAATTSNSAMMPYSALTMRLWF